jgi:hypothetical protein
MYALDKSLTKRLNNWDNLAINILKISNLSASDNATKSYHMWVCTFIHD